MDLFFNMISKIQMIMFPLAMLGWYIIVGYKEHIEVLAKVDNMNDLPIFKIIKFETWKKIFLIYPILYITILLRFSIPSCF